METRKEYYGDVYLDEEDALEIQNPIHIKYYKLKNISVKEEDTFYGIEVVKETLECFESEESQKIKAVNHSEKRVEDILEILKRNKVTPIELNDVIQDLKFQN